jgi:hypothetical protein
MRYHAISTFALVLLAGCAGVYARQSASDSETTRYDQRLVGFWRVDQGEAAGIPGGRAVFAIGRAEAGKSFMRLATISLDKDDVLSASRNEVEATTIADADYASVHVTDRDDSCVVFRYEAPDADTLRVVGMDENVVAADVRAQTVAGEVTEWTDENTKKDMVAVTLSGPTGELRAYLEKRADGIWRAGKPLVLRRLPLR